MILESLQNWGLLDWVVALGSVAAVISAIVSICGAISSRKSKEVAGKHQDNAEAAAGDAKKALHDYLALQSLGEANSILSVVETAKSSFRMFTATSKGMMEGFNKEPYCLSLSEVFDKLRDFNNTEGTSLDLSPSLERLQRHMQSFVAARRADEIVDRGAELYADLSDIHSSIRGHVTVSTTTIVTPD